MRKMLTQMKIRELLISAVQRLVYSVFCLEKIDSRNANYFLIYKYSLITYNKSVNVKKVIE